jgi:hypothetical protein
VMLRNASQACPCEGGGQFPRRVVSRKMTPRLDDFPQPGIHTFNLIGGVDHPSDLGRKAVGRDQLCPGPAAPSARAIFDRRFLNSSRSHTDRSIGTQSKNSIMRVCVDTVSLAGENRRRQRLCRTQAG